MGAAKPMCAPQPIDATQCVGSAPPDMAAAGCEVLYCAAPDDGDPAFGFELVEDDASQDGYVGVVSARGRELLEELAAALDGQSATAAAGGCGGASDLEAFYAHWYGAGVPGRRSGVRCPGWEWMQRLGAMCDEVCSGFDELLRDLESLERQRREVAAKTVALHEQCDARIKDASGVRDARFF